MVLCFTGPIPDSSLQADCTKYRLEDYIGHKIGISPAEIEPERFAIVEAEALRDLIVSSESAGTNIAVQLGPQTLLNPECARLVERHCKLCQ